MIDRHEPRGRRARHPSRLVNMLAGVAAFGRWLLVSMPDALGQAARVVGRGVAAVLTGAAGIAGGCAMYRLLDYARAASPTDPLGHLVHIGLPFLNGDVLQWVFSAIAGIVSAGFVGVWVGGWSPREMDETERDSRTTQASSGRRRSR